MKKFLFLVVSVLFAMPCHAQWNYPPTKTVEASDTYFGKTYNDPYRWLENLKDKDVEGWFKTQAELTDGLLAKIPVGVEPHGLCVWPQPGRYSLGHTGITR